MESVKSTMSDTMNKVMANKKMVFVLIVAALFIGLAYYVYVTYVSPKLNPDYVANKEYIDNTYGADGQDGKTAEVLLFYASWCPHSKSAIPEWNKVKSNMQQNGNIVNGYKIKFTEVNCDDGESPDIKQKLDLYKVEGYPTIKMIKGNEVIEYNAKTDAATLTEFINSVLQ